MNKFKNLSSRKKSKKKIDISTVRGYVYRNLAMREWSRKMLTQKCLGKYGMEYNKLIEEVLDEFEEQGLLSDERFAQCYIRDCRDNRGYGPIKTKMKLFEKGISPTLFEEYLAQDHEIWQVRCAQVQHKKYHCSPDDRDEYAAQMRFLTQRGFSTNQIKNACYHNSFWRERDDIMVPEEEGVELNMSFDELVTRLR